MHRMAWWSGSLSRSRNQSTRASYEISSSVAITCSWNRFVPGLRPPPTKNGSRRTSTIALCNATLPLALKIANKGYQKAAADDERFAEGINMIGGRVTNAVVAESLRLQYQPLKHRGAA